MCIQSNRAGGHNGQLEDKTGLHHRVSHDPILTLFRLCLDTELRLARSETAAETGQLESTETRPVRSNRSLLRLFVLARMRGDQSKWS